LYSFCFHTLHKYLSEAFLKWTMESGRFISLGVTTNTPRRTIETILPMKRLHQYLDWFVCW
jgi:beta-phosphoglucomutase-like phosphatase (HAD superfamily)